MDYRDKRRGTAHLTGIVVGAVVLLAAFAVIRLVSDRGWSPWWWLSAAVAGAIGGGLIGLLVNAEREDGEHDERVAEATGRDEAGHQAGRADAPLEGAEERDAARRATGARR
jgi:hypothetical protein